MTGDPSDMPATDRRSLRISEVGHKRRGALFVLSIGFYLALGDHSVYGLVTGVVTALIVVAALDHVAFRDEPTVRRTVPRLLRGGAFVPLLCWEILKANLAIAYVVLHPSLPIDPSFERIEPDTRTDLERAVLATSITLTPGTVVVDVEDDVFEIHALTEAARTDLLAGSLAAAVARVFHGRGGPSPADGESGPDNADEAGGGAR